MKTGFTLSATDIAAIGSDLIDFLKNQLRDTDGRKDWTKRNLDALRAFTPHGLDVVCSPSGGTSDGSELSRGEFLSLDFIADVDGTGILIAGESEWHNTPMRKITEDFEKLLYVRSPIKIIICRIDNRVTSAEVCKDIFESMSKICSDYAPGELYIIYCRKWSTDDLSGDEVFSLQIEGEPAKGSLPASAFHKA